MWMHFGEGRRRPARTATVATDREPWEAYAHRTTHLAQGLVFTTQRSASVPQDTATHLCLLCVKLFIHFDYTGFSLLRVGLLRCGERGLLYIVRHQRLVVASLAVEHSSRCAGSVVVARGLRCPMACVERSRTRDRTCVPCIGRWILNPWITRESPASAFYSVSCSPVRVTASVTALNFQ